MSWISLSLSSAIALFACTLAIGEDVQASTLQPPPSPWMARDPVMLNVENGPDNTTVLMAAGGELAGDMSVRVYSEPKHAWVQGFDEPADMIAWNVESPASAPFHVTALVETSEPDQQFKLAVDGGESLTFTVPQPGWHRYDAGTILVPGGVSRLQLNRIAPAGQGSIKSLELVPQGHWNAYQTRVNEFKSNQSRFSSHPYGLMFQQGGWSYPRHGEKGDLEHAANILDVEKVAQLAADSGASYVIWSVTWITYEISAPIAAVDGIVGHGRLTSKRDLIGDLADALSKRGIDLYLYYHTGQGSLYGKNDGGWWARQQFPREFTLTGTGDRRQFFDNWEKVITEMGERYRSKVQGWFFDDGLVYYPAPFERMGKAARAGNPERFVSYNPWVVANYTDFEDVSFGEACKSDDAPIDANGRYMGGPEAGLAAHCMVMMESVWGIYQREQETGPTLISADEAERIVRKNAARKAPTSFNVLMYADGEVSPDSRAALVGLKKRMAAKKPGQ